MLLHNCKNATINVNAAVKKLFEILLSDALNSDDNVLFHSKKIYLKDNPIHKYAAKIFINDMMINNIYLRNNDIYNIFAGIAHI